ncbi:HPt (histidine-containing phosphotransfer) domain-containing protein [Paracidovorax wautersii]|uniref:HPt (Histidine-containing phosphotransfer) domain-containing protein n=1 Tax=Paracidovorax wautersii TaxID=1177982 RepID=A0ABU1ID03_9BURK|nr:HPt (histidine-containing phosphotransfer) domain-containing protein [Paracidovorax wautersii]
MADTYQEGGGADFDLSQFYQIFFEEAGENLDQMEQMLLDLDLSAANDEELNGIFRCAHSIKGGSATFGFSDVAELTHQMESLLDRLRRHELQPIPQMVDVLLESADASRSLLARHQAGGQGDAVSTTELVRRISELAAGGVPSEAPAPAPAPVPVPPPPAPVAPPAGPRRGGSPGCRRCPCAGNPHRPAGAPGAGRRHQGTVPRHSRPGQHCRHCACAARHAVLRRADHVHR